MSVTSLLNSGGKRPIRLSFGVCSLSKDSLSLFAYEVCNYIVCLTWCCTLVELLSFIKIRNHLLQAIHKLVSHKFLMNESYSVEPTPFAILLHYHVNAMGKNVFVPLALGQDWKGAANTGGNMSKGGFLGVRCIWLQNSVSGGTVRASLLEAFKVRAGNALKSEKKLFCSGNEQGLLQLWFFLLFYV